MIRLDPFYPILPDTDWLARLLPQGIRLVQLRIKDKDQATVRAEIETSVALCTAYDCTLVVNDYWQDAIAAGAPFVHLGQQDLAGADLRSIRATGIKIGVSTHNEEELAAALTAEADYVALGPVYATTAESDALGTTGPSPSRRLEVQDSLSADRDRRHHAQARAARARGWCQFGGRHYRHCDKPRP